MSELPAGWGSATLGDLTASTRPICYGVLKPGPFVPGGVPLLKIQDLAGNVILRDRIQLISEDLDREFERSRLEGGEVLLSIQGTIGRTAVVPSEFRGANVSRTLAVVAPDERLNRRFLYYYFQHLALQGAYETGGSTRASLNIGVIRSMSVPLPGLAEQERIVAALEEHLSRLDAAEAAALSAERRIKALEKAIIRGASSTLDPPSHWRVVTVADAGTVGLGLQRSPKRHSGPNMRPYLRVANVFEDRIDGGDVMSMDMSDAEWERFRLRDGDVLLNEGQSPEYLGRPAVYRGDPPEVAFTNSLIRFQASEEVDPEWALLVFRSHMHNRRFMQESQITTNIAHLAAGRFKTIEFPIPPATEQRARVAEARSGLEACDRLRREAVASRKRSAALRRSLLAAAFSGELVPQHPDDEPASVLLEQIAAERAAAAPLKRQRKVTAS